MATTAPASAPATRPAGPAWSPSSSSRADDRWSPAPKKKAPRARRAAAPAAGTHAATIDFGRDVCGELAAAESREWLVTNGIGGFACGTLAGTLTRRYHGLLVAALKPPLGRTLLLSKLDETADYNGRSYPLSANRWGDGSVDPHGYSHIESFRLEGTTPVWTFALGDALLEKRLWMQPDGSWKCVVLILNSDQPPPTAPAS